MEQVFPYKVVSSGCSTFSLIGLSEDKMSCWSASSVLTCLCYLLVKVK